MEKIYITGHKNPDTDSIMSAITTQYLFDKLGYNVVASRQGTINGETEYILNQIGIEQPELNTSLPAGTHVILVDHNSAHESLDNIDELIIDRVIDHHNVKLNTGYPLYYRAEPVGCSNTIIFKMYRENNVEIPAYIAKCMLGAIISDTLLFKSPTCTSEDRKVAEELEQIAGVDKEEFGLALLKAGADLSKYTTEELLNLDAKTADFNGQLVTIAQVSTVDIPDTLKRKVEFEEGIKKIIKEKNLGLFMLLITDILENNSQIIAIGDHVDKVEKAYNIKLEDNSAFLKGVVSRKKQVTPYLTEAFKG